MFKKILSVLVIACMVLSLAACGSDDADKKSNSIIYGMNYDASTVDFANSLDDASGTVVRLITEPLLRYIDSTPSAGIAESWESTEDGLEWTFNLRQSKFADGNDVKASDFVYSIIRTLTAENALGNASDNDVNSIKNAVAFSNGECTAEEVGVTAVDEYTLKIVFDSPATEETFCNYCYSPAEQSVVEASGKAYGSSDKDIMGNGPFTIESWSHDSEIVLKKNPNYWNAEAIKLDEIKIVTNVTNDTAVDMMATGALDAFGFSKIESVEAVMDSGEFKIMALSGGAQFIHINAKGRLDSETGKWLGNLNFRKALSAALDREALVATVYTSDTAASCVASATEMGVETFFNDEYDTGKWSTTQDLESATAFLKAAMDELGAKDVSEIPTFKMLAMDSTGNVTALNAVADMWNKALGINCELDMQPMMGMLGKVMSGDFDFWKGGSEVEVDTLDFMGDYTTSDGYYGFDDSEFDALYEAAQAAADKKGRKDALAELITYFTDNMMDLEVTWQGSNLVYNGQISGVSCNVGNTDLTFAEIQ